MLKCPKWSWVLSALVIVSCLSVSVWFFVSGFLLTRVELMQRTPQPRNIANASSAPFKKAVVIVLDALRFDFLWSSISGKPSRFEHYYSDRLSAFSEAARDPGAVTWFYEAIADAPTTTMQRLKAIATGGLPTFIDVGSNFNSAAIDEDSWVEQAHKAGKKVTFMGDDTWMSLFPNVFDKSYPYPSFDVMDLHTVDAGVTKHLVPEILKNESDIIIAHFLGVDHTGHRHGADHPVMSDKLEQLNDVLKTVMRSLPQDTLLMVFGDHGMTEDGNHGGASPAEASAGLVLYYKADPLHPTTKKTVVEYAARLTNTPISHKTATASARTVYQIDLVPTISKALGFQIPFGNLGMVLPEPFIDRQNGDETILSLLQAARDNVKQIKTYLHAYADRVPSFASSINMPELDSLTKNKKRVSIDWVYSDADDDESRRKSEEAEIITLYNYYSKAAESCRKLWASLDMPKMCWGMVLACGGTIMCIVYVLSAAKGLDDFPAVGTLFGVALGVLYSLSVRHYELPIIGNYGPLVACIALGIEVAFTIDTVSHVFVKRDELADTTWQSVASVVAVLLHAICNLSNSFEEAEDSVARYFLNTLAFVVFFTSALGAANQGNLRVLSGGTWKKIVLLAAVVRASSFFSVHGQRLESFTTFGSSHGMQHLSFICLSILPLIALSWLSERYLWDNRKRSRVSQILSNVALALVGLYWFMLQIHSSSTGTKEAAKSAFEIGLKWSKLIIPHIVWALSIISSLIVLVRGFRFTITRNTMQGCQLIMPIGYGSFLASVSVPIIMAMGPHAAFPVALMFVQIHLIADLGKKLGYKSCIFSGIMMAFTGIQYFYATGHTPQISDISFDAGFIGFEKAHWIVGFFLVLFNTVGAPLLCLLALPLLRPSFEQFELHRWWQFVSLLSFWATYAIAMCGTILFIFLEPRHLMIWRVFCPRLLFDIGMTSVYFIVAVLLLLLLSLNKLYC